MATYDTEIAALADVTAGQTLAEAGGVGHAAVENRQNDAARALAAYLDSLGASTVLSINGETGTVTLTAADVDAVPESAGIQYREYDGGAWPVRGTVPAGTVVIWLKRDVADPDPPINATYALTGVDLALLAQA